MKGKNESEQTKEKYINEKRKKYINEKDRLRINEREIYKWKIKDKRPKEYEDQRVLF